ncbi:putative ABC transport system permease protein [Algoriphagus boseongensis]|uniref:Putative ABC transport system permease protein n=1 Tax=Algoriphagus boseongensis TaxID=1442587 RepID=A0A4R6TA74_9BACT|nr:ABC transporter permease [Algoriphagus boseongensis]TDQ18495.1 putative ABC transport system permease protein [Algoriphagus boseongensis]
MFKNYFKIVFRNAKKHPMYVFINLFGLAIGMTVSILILLYVQFELSYDDYHPDKERIFRVSRAWFNPDGDISLHLGHTAPPFGPLIKSDFPEDVEVSARIFNFDPLIKSGENAFEETRFFFADPESFDVFSWEIVEGEGKSALSEADGLVITESTAKRYFGDSPAVGKDLLILLNGQEVTFQVRGVMKDMPENSHFHVDFLASMVPVVQFYGGLEAFMGNFGSNNFSTFIKLNEGLDYKDFEAKLPSLIDRHMGETQSGIPMSKGTQLFLWPITDIHLYSNLDSEIEPNGNIDYVYIYLAVAFFILLIACINFMNLSTARSSLRSMEVGLRKVMGADKGLLIRQFLGESFVMTIFSMVLALVLVYLFLPTFGDFTERPLSLNLIQSPEYLLLIFGIIAFVGLISGSYPALFLSGFMPAKVLKGAFKAGKAHERFRSVLVVGQFAISVMLIVAVLVVVNQLSFMQSKDLGFKKEDIVVLPSSGAITENYLIFKDRLENHPGVNSVTISSRVPSGRLLDSQGATAEVNGEMNQLNIRIADIHVGHNFLETYGIDLVAGRNFNFQLASDSTEAFILNETSVREIGWSSPEEAIGKQFLYGGRRGFVTGVMKDFHFESLHQPIVPIVFMISQDRNNQLSIKIDSEERDQVLAYLKEEWAQMRPDFPFEPLFVDEGFNRQYEAENRVKTIFTFFSVLAILISVLGLLGLVTFATEQRTREIGIRKVMGAETSNILLLLGRDFLKLVVLGFLLAIPISWFGMNKWLDDFAYHIGVHWTVFLWAGLLAGAIAAITITSQTIKAAWANPIKSIKSE